MPPLSKHRSLSHRHTRSSRYQRYCMPCVLWVACTLPPSPIPPIVRRFVFVCPVFHSADWASADSLHGTFAESQIKAARENLEFSLRMTVDLFGSLQGTPGFSYPWFRDRKFFCFQPR